MKLRTLFFVFALVVMVVAPGVSAIANEDVVPQAEGFTVGLVFDALTSTQPGVRVGYWWQYVGVDLTLQGSASEAELSDGTDSVTFIEESEGYAGLGLKAGVQLDRAKIFGRFGLGSSVASDEVLEVDLSSRVFELTLGIDFAVSENLVLGINILEARALSGTFEDKSGASNQSLDIDGATSRFLQGGHISFQF